MSRVIPRTSPGRGRLGLALLSFAVVLLIAFNVTPGPRTAEGTAAGPVRLVFLGDINLDGHPGKVIADGGSPFEALAPLLTDADLVVGNLECVIATTGTPFEKPYTFRAHPRVLPHLARYVGAVSLANNHTGDFGQDAFREQLNLLRRQRLPYFGGGGQVVEARTPLVLERRGLRIALLGYNDYHSPREFEAGPAWPGVAWAVDEQITADIQAARSIHRADLVIPFMHWGWEEYPANDRQKKLARLMIDCGADVVVGTHPHVVQEVEAYQGHLIVYSIGNCIFEGFEASETQLGWVLRMNLARGGAVRWDTVPIRLGLEGIPRLAKGEKSPVGEIPAGGPPRIEQRRFQP